MCNFAAPIDGRPALLTHDNVITLFHEFGHGLHHMLTQVEELGELETPILLTNTLSVPRVADALVEWMLGLPGNEDVRSVNPLVAETNDGQLNDIRGRHVGREEVFAALKNAKGGEV